MLEEMKQDNELNNRTYIEQLNNQYQTEDILKIEKYGIDNNVPIIKKDSLFVLLGLLESAGSRSILEIGCAIGYSSICMASNSTRVITTLERDLNMVQIARKNVETMGLSNQVHIVSCDALNPVDEVMNKRYDAIFIDAAKSQYQKFFDLYIPLLNPSGIIVCDNILFHGNVAKVASGDNNMSKNLFHLATKVSNFNSYLQQLVGFHTLFLNVGDGMSVTKRIKP